MRAIVRRPAALAAALLLPCACRGPVGSQAAVDAADPTPHILLKSTPSGNVIDVGLPADALLQLKHFAPNSDQWASLLRVTVSGVESDDPGERPAMLGAYSLLDRAVRFTPQFPLDPGQAYDVVFNPVGLPVRGGTWRSLRRVKLRIPIPVSGRQARTRVVEVYPTSEVIPENQLRLYILFSAPMGLGGVLDHVRLIEDTGQVLDDPFLPLDVNLWDENQTRFTLLFDPGRVKRGILPHEEMGRSLAAGRKYTLLVDSDWRDAAGQPLASAFHREFRVGPPEERAINPADWQMERPAAGTRDPLAVSFRRPLDFALLHRALAVSRATGERVEGGVQIERAETRWLFTPRDPWVPGGHRLLAAAILEDGAGNRIGRAFEVDERVAPGAQRPRSAVLPFQISSGPP
jgi:hypothetical protein